MFYLVLLTILVTTSVLLTSLRHSITTIFHITCDQALKSCRSVSRLEPATFTEPNDMRPTSHGKKAA